MFKYLLLANFILLETFCFGQKLTGKIMDSASSEALPFATISVKAADGSIITGTLSDENGSFSVQIPKNASSIEVDHIGYDKHIIEKPFTGKKLSTIALSINATQIDEVVISGEKTTREFYIDRKVINFGEDLQASGGSVFEAFQQLPELETNPTSGSLLLRGNSNVRILVNGKPSPLNNKDLLEQLDAAQVERVEIITSPSAKYQADGLAGIVNIILKDRIIRGIASSISLNGRTNPGYGGSFNLTSGFEKFNLQATVAHRNNFYGSKELKSRFFPLSGELQGVVMHNEFDGHVNTLNFKADWFFDKQNDLSFAVNLTHNEHEIESRTSIKNDLENISNRLVNFHRHNTGEYNLNYRRKFNQEGTNYLDIDINYNDNNNTLPSTILINEQLSLDNQIFYNNDIINSAIDFVGFPGSLKLEAGGLYTLKTVENKQSSFYSTEIINSQYSYDEYTYAGYLVLKKQLNKTGIQVGLRSEWFASDGYVSETNGVIKRNYFNIFPSLHLQHKRSDSLNYTLAYNRRITRPSFYNINPITTINNPLFRRIGNPGLKPEFTDNLEFGINYITKKIAINTSIYYRYMTDIINSTFNIDEEDITIMSFTNGGRSQTIGTELSISKDLSEKISASITSNAYLQYTQPKFDDFFFEEQYNYNIRTNCSIKPMDNLTLDVQFLFFGKSRQLNLEANDRNLINLAARYKVLKNKGSINLRFTDVLRGNVFESKRLSNEIIEYRKWLGQTRVAILSFTYNFSKGDIRKRKSKRNRYGESGALE